MIINVESRSNMAEDPMVDTNPQVVITLATASKINGVLQRIGTLLSFLEISLYVGVERRIVVGILPISQTLIMLTRKI